MKSPRRSARRLSTGAVNARVRRATRISEVGRLPDGPTLTRLTSFETFGEPPKRNPAPFGYASLIRYDALC